MVDALQFSFTLLLADDDEMFCSRCSGLLQQEVDRVLVCHTARDLMEILHRELVDLVFLDLKLPDMDGLKALKLLKAAQPDVEVVMITGHSSVTTAVDAIQQGASNYLCKPVRRHDLLIAVEGARQKAHLKKENEWLRNQLDSQEENCGLIGQSEAMVSVTSTLRKVAPLDCNVIIQGETGTGKQLAARALHRLSGRKDRPFIAFNCGGFAEELIANELFGHEKGAFTGANSRKIGLLEAGNHGTIFFDEIGEMSLAMQVKLLHVLEERQILRLGSTSPVDLDIRVIVATNRDLRKMVRAGSFREDLFFRLNVVVVELPPLRDREGDLPLLISHFLGKYNHQFGKSIDSLSQDVMDSLAGYRYPGNVRELENVIQRAVALCGGSRVCLHHLPEEIEAMVSGEPHHQMFLPLAEVEKEHIRRVLRFSGGDRKMAATILGLPRTTLWRRIRQYGLEDSHVPSGPDGA